MSRVAKAPINVPAGVEVTLNGQDIKVKGKNGELARSINVAVDVALNDNVITTQPNEGVANGWAQAGTARANINNMIVGVTTGYEKKLQLIGVGYRAAVKGKVLNLTLGFSHPVNFEIPEGITIEAPSQTELLVKGADKQLVGQVSANIRAYRKPEPYKGKGVRYSDEVVRRKEAKKK